MPDTAIARPGLIGMAHIPINTILASPAQWRRTLGLPECTSKDWDLVARMESMSSQAEDPDTFSASVKALSFYRFLEDRMLSEAAVYMANGYNAVMLENVAAPYFVRGQQPAVIYCVMRALAERLRAEHPKVCLGIQILAFSDDLAMDIACRCEYDFIRSESTLFEGLRPEGRTPNKGNLARLYFTRNRRLSKSGKAGDGPQVWVDICKKHTVYEESLSTLDLWLENVFFQKIEGIIVTGESTGDPAKEIDLAGSRAALEKVAADSMSATGTSWAPPLVAGSGASVANIGMYRKYIDGVIVGSFVKKGQYWECPLDEDRVRIFAEAWHGSGK